MLMNTISKRSFLWIDLMIVNWFWFTIDVNQSKTSSNSASIPELRVSMRHCAGWWRRSGESPQLRIGCCQQCVPHVTEVVQQASRAYYRHAWRTSRSAWNRCTFRIHRRNQVHWWNGTLVKNNEVAGGTGLDCCHSSETVCVSLAAYELLVCCVLLVSRLNLWTITGTTKSANGISRVECHICSTSVMIFCVYAYRRKNCSPMDWLPLCKPVSLLSNHFQLGKHKY